MILSSVRIKYLYLQCMAVYKYVILNYNIFMAQILTFSHIIFSHNDTISHLCKLCSEEFCRLV
jgi:hypothetical protein